MVAGRTEILQAIVAMRAHDIIRFHGVSAVAAFAVLHELATLQGNIERLFIAVFSGKFGTHEQIDQETDQRHQREDAPCVPVRAART